jgi:malate dehydrogenase (oxaloacetate-decarboxylating)
MEIAATVPLRDRDDLSLAYTPGVAEVCTAIAADPAPARA